MVAGAAEVSIMSWLGSRDSLAILEPAHNRWNVGGRLDQPPPPARPSDRACCATSSRPWWMAMARESGDSGAHALGRLLGSQSRRRSRVLVLRFVGQRAVPRDAGAF